MAEINLLDRSVYNRIAAGEVVAGPHSVVKELAENAVDAGAGAIEIAIESGGIASITVTDNGSGIPHSEVKKAFLPHATSKIKTAEDMETVGTLGFRGEALPSIASVSKVLIRTKAQNEETGTLLRLRQGEEEEFGACALSEGTIIEVEALFFNTPARLKFLKSARSEEAAVTETVKGLILSNPEVSIRYSADGDLKLASDGSGLAGAVKSVYPALFDNLLSIRYAEKGYSIHGFISKPGFVKGNRSAQTIVLNGRTVTDPALSASIQNAYGERLMTRTFPIFVLDIVMPFDLVDVNVHPSKAEVRLRDARKLYGLIYRAVKERLENNDREVENAFLAFADRLNPEEILVDASENNGTMLHSTRKEPIAERLNDLPTDRSEIASDALNKSALNREIVSDQNGKSDLTLENFQQLFENTSRDNVTGASFQNSKSIFENQKTDSKTAEFMHESRLTERFSGVSKSDASKLQDTYPTSLRGGSEFRVVGQIFKCYLVIESGDCGFIIDQHAAHERTIYDRLLQNAEAETPESQPLLLPFIFRGSADECEFILKNSAELYKIGFEIEDFGNNTIKVNAVPSVLTGIDFSAFFLNLVADASAIQSLKSTDFLRGKLAQLACKSAIKAGDELTPQQIDYFIEVYTASGAPILCPHGRPTVIPFDKLELEKRFKRKL